MLDYVQRLLWTSGELGGAVCRRGWREPDVWALAPGAEASAGAKTSGAANAWVDDWLSAQGRLADRFCFAAQDLLGAPYAAASASGKAPGRGDVRGEESYLVVSKDEFAAGTVEAVTGWMISDEFILYVIEDSWPFDASRPLPEMADKVRHVLVPVSEGESYGVVSGG
jgi:hypothetical protein